MNGFAAAFSAKGKENSAESNFRLQKHQRSTSESK